MTKTNCIRISTPDGSDQAVHPDVVYVPHGFLGFQYWMACTPYPFGDDRAENPILRVSNDGLDWIPFPGAPDPLVPPPQDPSWHHADTDMVIYKGVLHLFYMSTNRDSAETVFYLITSYDGANWTKPIVIYSDEWGVSPAVVINKEGKWLLWYVWIDSLSNTQTSQLYLRVGETPTKFGSPELCALIIPNYVLWHLDVLASEEGYQALITAFPIGTDPSRCCLFHASSTDGISFIISPQFPIFKPRLLNWDNRIIYRSTFIKLPNENYRIWYSGSSWAKRWGIGILEGPLTKLCPSNVDRNSNQPTAIKKIQEDLKGLIYYLISKKMPKFMISIIRVVRNKFNLMNQS